MSTSPTRVMASVVAVVILAFPAVHALPDPAPVPTAEAPAPSTEAPLSAPPAEKAAPASVTESPAAPPEAEVPAPPPAAETLSLFKPEQLDQLLAPIALYPDALLAQILMAATYPLEVVKADRWLQDPAHAYLQGDQLAAALRGRGVGSQRQVAGAVSSDPADDGRSARLDGAAGQRRRGTAGRGDGCDPTSSPPSRGRGDVVVRRPAAGNHRTARHCYRAG